MNDTWMNETEGARAVVVVRCAEEGEDGRRRGSHNSQWSVVNGQSSMVSRQWSVACGQRSAVSGQRSGDSGQWSV